MHEAAVAGVVERRRAVLRAAVVPQQCVADAPGMTVDEFVAVREVEQERDQLGRFLSLVAEHKHKIGFGGPLLIEPKPFAPTKHQYDYDAAAGFAAATRAGRRKRPTRRDR